jgi:uncharacterized protein YdeI (YjbR/CyaY-like superfamily)
LKRGSPVKNDPSKSADTLVNEYLSASKKWREAMTALRDIVLTCALTEELKWGVPCYTHAGNNVVLIHEFKEYCAILFVKGALLQDPRGILVQQTRNTQASRQIRFTDVTEVLKLKAAIKAYVKEAIEIEKAHVKVAFKATEDFALPEELKRRMEGLPALKTAFYALTPGRQRAYLIHFTDAKQAKTREARIEKCLPRILEGIGLND